MRKNVIEVDDDDVDFLSQVAAVEAAALSAKRRKFSTPSATSTANSSTPKPDTPTDTEGAYLSVLRGNRSPLLKQQFAATSTSVRNNNSNNNSSTFAGADSGGGGDSCFKCGKSGHWARDCDASGSHALSLDPSVPEKACPCGLGSCLENGGCSFFEWCDNPSGTDNMTIRRQTYTTNPSVHDLPCPCGAGSCLTLTTKTGKNIGRQFYRCPGGQEPDTRQSQKERKKAQAVHESPLHDFGWFGGCGFFKWCDDQTMATGLPESVHTPKVHKNIHEVNSKSSSASGSSCYKCGKDGHWSRDCPQSSHHSTPVSKGNSTSSNTCYKCGQPGHWAKDCSSGGNVTGRYGQY
ncbi:hypothetical protein RJ639_004712 [Escallonia herrerae]|uniref:Uncharacterized protein n=1 Tax=Escallonia herrerae TaxID=1293975 RepID=A0AA88W4C8_9ASTE|nr:hypothetical protein RJ639_004712 [Escallonia herrerae]